MSFSQKIPTEILEKIVDKMDFNTRSSLWNACDCNISLKASFLKYLKKITTSTIFEKMLKNCCL